MEKYSITNISDFKELLLQAKTIDDYLLIHDKVSKSFPSSNTFNYNPNSKLEQSFQLIKILKDLKHFIQINKINKSDAITTKIYKDNKDNLVCYICCLNTVSIDCLKNINVYGLWGDYCANDNSERDYFYLDASLKLNCQGTPMEIRRIYAGKEKRTGKGSLGIKFLEEYLITDINNILNFFGYKNKISYIYGISAELSPDTNNLARAKFYSKNNFILSNSHFYKYL
jgi:hypothetical protein